MNSSPFIPDSHPRAESLRIRHKLIEGFHQNVVAEAGLIAHGRGEAFDYLIGEQTREFAEKAIEAAIAQLILANHPVLSVNGNVAALVPDELVKLSKTLEIPLEINLFYRTRERETAIYELLMKHGATNVLGYDLEYRTEIEEITHLRRIVDKRGIKVADVVFVPLEDGDRTMTLKALGRKVISIDLNPMSRTAIHSTITIVDNVIRAIPLMVEQAKKAVRLSKKELEEVLREYNNQQVLKAALQFMAKYAQTYEFPIE